MRTAGRRFVPDIDRHGGCLSPYDEIGDVPGLHAYLRWRNANAHHRDALAAERREHARIRSEKGIR